MASIWVPQSRPGRPKHVLNSVQRTGHAPDLLRRTRPDMGLSDESAPSDFYSLSDNSSTELTLVFTLDTLALACQGVEQFSTKQ
jgi:hypothetical protein